MNRTGTELNTTDYEPFGGPLTGVAPRQGYIGKEKDRESDLADHGVRKYDYDLGRFMSVDPLWEKYVGQTSYNYSANNPIVQLDPTGFIVDGIDDASVQSAIDYFTDAFDIWQVFEAGPDRTVVINEKYATDEGKKALNLSEEMSKEFDRIKDIIQRTDKRITFFAGKAGEKIDLSEVTKSEVKIAIPDNNGGIFVAVSSGRAFILINTEIANKDRFETISTRTNGILTEPCGSCLVMHEFLDHGSSWIENPSDKGKSGVKHQNIFLKSKGSRTRFPMTDHED